jgi:ureidoacrylate peracid hydrolase
MHKTNITLETINTATKRRGGSRYAFENITPEKTALVVIDMQNYFMKSGMAAEVPVARDIVPNINKLATTLRNAGGQVIWVITSFDDDTYDEWSVLHSLFSEDRRKAMMDNLVRGKEGHKLWSEFDVMPSDLHIEKNRYSAFIHGSSNLDTQLKEEGIDTVLITGTLTDVCCECSARDAMMMNYKTIMVTDANAASSDEDHNNALNALGRLFVDLYSTDELIVKLDHQDG